MSMTRLLEVPGVDGDTGLYLVARHGEHRAFPGGRGLGAPRIGSGASDPAPHTPLSRREVCQAPAGG